MSTAYYPSVAADDAALPTAAEQTLLRFPFYGYRKLSKELMRQRHPVGERVARRLLRELILDAYTCTTIIYPIMNYRTDC